MEGSDLLGRDDHSRQGERKAQVCCRRLGLPMRMRMVDRDEIATVVSHLPAYRILIVRADLVVVLGIRGDVFCRKSRTKKSIHPAQKPTTLSRALSNSMIYQSLIDGGEDLHALL